ncbi:MAG TPA: hypothetical protein ENH91_14520 [Leeuwenhoekiella sp.]|nr:hypothetical protein [Leeuwenhoekiella sp.]
MNPSSTGWIAKQILLLKKSKTRDTIIQCYNQARNTGFIYGVSVDLITPQPHFIHTWTLEEKTKVNLFDALAYTYKNHHNNLEYFSQTALTFYEKLLNGDQDSTSKTQDERKSQTNLEKIIHTRIKTSDSVLKKNFSAVLINALLYIDVLAFQHYSETSAAPRPYATNLEFLILNVICIAVEQKVKKSGQDQLLLDLFKKSLRYHKNKLPSSLHLESLAFKNLTKTTEKKYILDVASLLFYDDLGWHDKQEHFLYKLAKHLDLSAENVLEAQENLRLFIEKNRAIIPYFNTSYPLKHFYDQTSVMVHTLILRNKKRLLQEIIGSKDLVLLLGKSTYKELSKEERKKVKTQLLDICKGVPSLAIFLLPGGSILLPLLIHYIPELLPSAFDENRIEDNPEEQ